MPELHRSAVTRVAGTARSQQAHLVISAVRQPLWQPLRRRVVIAMLLWAATAGAFLAVADLPQMMASLSRYEGKGLALFVLLTLGGYTLRLLKWDYLLRMEGIVMSRKDSSLVFLSGLAMAVTPAKAGELLKAYLVHQVHGAAASAAVPVVIAERVTDVAALALLAGAGALQFRYGVEGVAATLAVVAGVIVILRSSRWTSPASVVLGRFRPAARILPMMREMQHSTRRVFGMIPLVNTTILSVCAWALECTILYLLFAGVGFPQSFLVSSFTFAFAAVAGTLSLAPGGVGVAEGSLVASMLWLGVPLEPAVTVAVLLRVVTFWLGLILGVASLAIVSRRLARSVPSGRRIVPEAAGGCVMVNGIPAPPDAVRTRWPIAVVVVVALVMHGWLATLPVNELISRGLLNDDAFYAFTIARNIAQGYGSTFDRVTLTNGYQPLYVWLLVPIFRLWDDLESPVRVAFGVLALVNVLSGLLLYRLIIRLTNDAGAAAVGTAYWVVNPLFVKRTLNGLETPLAVAMLLLVLLYWTTWLAGGAAQRNGRWLGFGLLLGTALLTRMDLVFAAAALCAAGALIHRAERPRYVVRWLLAAMGIAVALSPWMWFGLSRVGSALPMSAESVRHWIVYRTGGTPNLLQRLDWASRSVISITMATSAWSLLRAKWPVAPLWMAGVLVGTMVAAAALLILPGMRARGRRVWLAHREVHLACGLYVGCMFVFYSFYMPAIWYFDRYYAPVYAVYALYAGLLTHHLWTGGRGETRRSAGRGLRRIAPAVAAIPLLLFFGSYFGPGSRNGFYEAALWMRQNLPADARVGSYLAGYLGYFSDRQVINLDGKVNREAMLALQAGRMREYLRGAGVSFVADWPSYLRALEARGGPVVGRDLVRRIYVDRSFFDYSIFVFDPQR